MYYGRSANTANIMCKAHLSTIYLPFSRFTPQLSSNFKHLRKPSSPNWMPVRL